MPDFTRSHYLGFRHSSRSLRPWSHLTTGLPAALAEPAPAQVIARQLARLQGCQGATLGRSTLHLFWDLFGLLTGQPVAIFLDRGSYPIAKWGVERASARGVPVRYFPHKNVGTLQRLLRQNRNVRPVVVSDGLCATCGCTLPLAAYLEQVRDRSGLLVIDDTQAIGLLGTQPRSAHPYGQGGGGSLRHGDLGGADVVTISSLAKAFGVPLAVLAGSETMVRKFEAESETRVHCSPPSTAAWRAAERALQLNTDQGDTRRRQLARRVRQFRKRLAEVGLVAEGNLFPVQTLNLPPYLDPQTLYQELLDLGLRTILRGGHDGRPQLSLIITADHRPDEIDEAVQMLVEAISLQPHAERGGG